MTLLLFIISMIIAVVEQEQERSHDVGLSAHTQKYSDVFKFIFHQKVINISRLAHY